MSQYAKLDARVLVLERQMPEIRKLASDASIEAGDVHARLRAHAKSLEALRTTQLDHHKEMRNGFAEMHEGFTEMRQGFATLNVGMAQIVALLGVKQGESDES